MESILVIFGLLVIGLLVALVVLGALMYTNMRHMCGTSDRISSITHSSAIKLEAAHQKLAASIAPMAAALAPMAAAAAAAAASATAASGGVDANNAASAPMVAKSATSTFSPSGPR
jgi:hypothetical protein